MPGEDAPHRRRPAWVSDRLFPFPSRFADLDGCRVHYVDAGSGPSLLLLHGNPTWSFLYRHIIQGLRDRFRCIAPDYPGFGLSTPRPDYDFQPSSHAAVLEQLLLTLDLRDVTLMVQDWGGPIGLELAARHPERFRAFVVGNTFAWPVDGDLHFEIFARFWGGPLGRFLCRRFNGFVNLMLPIGAVRRRPNAEIMAHYRAPFPTPASRQPTWVLPREMLASRAYLADLAPRLSGLANRPALLVWGDRDPAFRWSVERRRFEALFPRHRTVRLVGAGHFIQEDAPREIVSTIRAWWVEAGAHPPLG